MSTNRCIKCGEPVVVWAGHVHLNGKLVLAGWCFNHNPQIGDICPDARRGCFGDWKPEYGLSENDEESP